MKRLHFPKRHPHPHSPVQNVNEMLEEHRTLGQRAADRIAGLAGSWPFIITQTVILSLWATLNVTVLVFHWDPYPFILMNLVLSLQAAYTAPLIMMSQKRGAERDRVDAHNDYLVNVRAETEIRAILEHLEAQNHALQSIYHRVTESEETPHGQASDTGEST